MQINVYVLIILIIYNAKQKLELYLKITIINKLSDTITLLIVRI